MKISLRSKRSGTFEVEYCSALPQLSTITAVKHDWESQLYLRGAVAAARLCSNVNREAALQTQGTGLQIMPNRYTLVQDEIEVGHL